MANLHSLNDLNSPNRRNVGGGAGQPGFGFGQLGNQPPAGGVNFQQLKIPFLSMDPNQERVEIRKETFWDMLKLNLCPNFKVVSLSVLLITVNILVFMYTCSKGIKQEGSLLEIQMSTLIDSGAVSTVGVKQNREYWRLLFSLFLHLNIIHLFSTCVTLVIIASAIEYSYGFLTTFLIYILSGLTGNLFAVSMVPISFEIAYGPSICITGLFASVLAYFILNWKGLEVLGPAREYILCLFIMLLLLFVLFPSGGATQLSTYGNIGGFLNGLLLGILIPAPLVKSEYTNYVKIFCGVIFGLFILLSVLMIMADN